MSVEFLNLRHLRAFMEVADAHGISAAAHKVHLSQPAVTQAISGLEARLGTKLLDRRTEGMFPTKAGGALLARVRRMFGHLAHGAALAVRIGRREGKPVPDFHLRVTAAQLRALIAIRDAGNFSLAARTLGISQPSIHRAGRDLEKLSGMELFSAGRRGIELTPQAEAFARSVKLAEAELNQGLDDLTRLAGRDSTRITVGSMPLSRTRILPEAIDALLAGSAGVQIRTIDAPYAELLRGLRYGDIDVLIGALRDPVPVDDVVQEPLFEDRLSVVAGPNHPLAGRRNIGISDTLAYPWIAPPKETPGGSYLFRTLQIGDMQETPVRIVSSSMVLVRGLLARGDYLTILSPHQAEVEIAHGDMVQLDMDLPDSRRPIGLTTRTGWVPTATQARFLDLIRAAATRRESPPSTQIE
ncbi:MULTISPECIES: LysR family transcriptional regulator [Maritimibacter]|uniref:Transcriptional regulator, LysR family protein n=1 Tax=Maritimibacter alkaliphilus HTCC2654 TaxID=314271 RepID=A3VB04_9RHOB|nr:MULTISPECIES: LysR family transcriptional regulator [Maritimibacter]EAQ15095.1 transcriptional regulator, LysR family protein [Maritimibacter alkaliphilus HTCC2654]TYP78675.1 DNA-binding transcriptional LysR family regulator [Maritimibacter alkaliphilus HTCC2654]